MTELIRTQEGAVLTLTLNRPAQRNSLSAGVVEELLRALADAQSAPEVKAVVLTGAGEKAFCAGGDLSSAMGDGFLAGHEGRRRYAALLEALVGMEKPTLARVNGHALAGGLGLVLACDLALAADDAQFGTPEIDVGLFPYMVTALLQRTLAPKYAYDLVLTGRRLDAAEAARIGLINRAVPRAELDREVSALAAQLAEKSPAILRLGKRAMRLGRDLPLPAALELLACELSVNTLAEDAAEGVAAFREKRAPEWKGR